jgi:hypothetical protein
LRKGFQINIPGIAYICGEDFVLAQLPMMNPIDRLKMKYVGWRDRKGSLNLSFRCRLL